MNFDNDWISPINLKQTRSELMLLAKVLREYKTNGKTSEEFEKDFGCKLEMCADGISGVEFQNDSNKMMFMLKYKL